MEFFMENVFCGPVAGWRSVGFLGWAGLWVGVAAGGGEAARKFRFMAVFLCYTGSLTC